MKTSRYNFLFKFEGKNILFNSKTTALAMLSDDEYDKLAPFVEKENISIDADILDPDLVKNLSYGGFFIDDSFDEIKSLRFDMFKARFNSSSLSLTIAPTLACNFNCPYCYERTSSRNLTITDDVKQGLYEFVKSYIGIINNLSITWYGGEPLLCLKDIEEMTTHFKEICKDEVFYSAGMTTNGYLLDKETLLKLKDLSVSNIQIPFDGFKEKHDKTRCLSDGSGSFDKIIANLVSFKSLYDDKNNKLPSISLRLNTTRENHKDMIKLINYLKEKDLLDYTSPYLAKIDDPLDKVYKNCLTYEEFALLEKEFNADYASLTGKQTSRNSYPAKISAVCGCDSLNSYVIDPQGYLYKCWEEIGKREFAIGNLKDGVDYKTIDRAYDYMLYDPSEDIKCANCKILPLCMGGVCPYRRINNVLPSCDNKMKTIKSNLMSFLNTKEIKEAVLNESFAN